MFRFCDNSSLPSKLFPDFFEDSLDNNQLSNFGPSHKQLTTQLKAAMALNDHYHLLLTSSGHTALMAAYYVASTKGYRSVSLPAYTFASTAQAATLQGLKTTYYDVEKRTGLVVNYPDNDRNIKVIVSPHGTPIPSDKYKDDSSYVIFDSAAAFLQPHLYADADVVCHSFHATKVLPIGEGGCAVFRSREDYEMAKAYINFGLQDGVVVSPGINGKLSELSCAMGLTLIETNWLSQSIDHRRNLVKYAITLLGYDYYVHVLNDENIDDYNYPPLPYIPVMVPEEKAHLIVETIKEKLDTEVRIYYKPLVSYLPISKKLGNSTICVPCHRNITEQLLEDVMDLIIKISYT